jgi:uncharacterized protein (DUF2267 family)
MVRKVVTRGVAVTMAALGAVAVFGRNTPVGRGLQRFAREGSRRLRYVPGWWQGVRYRLAGATPDPEVSDDVLADRVRSTLGPLEKRLDVPRVGVISDSHIVLLHGEVPTAEDAEEIERVVQHTSGVRGVESYLHVGLSAGTERPSVGRAASEAAPSDALRQLRNAARDAGASVEDAPIAARAVLSALADRLPEDERDQFLAQLPADVRGIAGVPRRHGERATRVRTVPELVAAVVARGGVDPDSGERITRSVLGRLRLLVPHEAHDVAAVLPEDLRRLWTSATPA